MEKVIMYRADDGKLFSSEAACVNYEHLASATNANAALVPVGDINVSRAALAAFLACHGFEVFDPLA